MSVSLLLAVFLNRDFEEFIHTIGPLKSLFISAVLFSTAYKTLPCDRIFSSGKAYIGIDG